MTSRTLSPEIARHTAAPRPARARREWPLKHGDDIFRGIYTRSGASEGETLAICSALVGEGKTTLALGLTATIAQDFPQLRVALVELDLARPVLAEDFGVPQSPGLVEYLTADHPIALPYRSTYLENLFLVPAGEPHMSPARLLRSERMAAAIEALRNENGIVVLDIPAVLATSDALLVTDLADGIIFVTRAGVTPKSILTRGLDQIDGAKLRGVVLNDVHSAIPSWLRRLVA